MTSSPSDYLGTVITQCESLGLRLTPLRRRLLELIAASSGPIKAYDLLDELRHEHPKATPVLVYRTLEFLLDNGFVHKLKSINAFIACQGEHAHRSAFFLICDQCSSADEIVDESVQRAVREQAKRLGFRADSQVLEVHGACVRCSDS